MAESGRALRAVLYLTLAVVAGFGVSAVAGLWDEEPAETGLRALGRGTQEPAQIRVEVLNGAGTPGLARDATARLREAGFDVVFFGNAARFDHRRSFVLDRVARPDLARAVGAALGIDSVATTVDSSLMLEATVVLGKDWPPPPPPPSSSWWDRIRRRLGQDTLP